MNAAGSQHEAGMKKPGLKSLLASTALLLGTTALGINALTPDPSTSACVCSGDTTYNDSLPSSHPNNRCANQGQGLSWVSWLTGSNRSNQAHFVDLLELLHGHTDKPLENITPNSQKNF
ncbi:hypothetical protein LZP73_07400 [Shewanella sp. AS16]|uniref:hypothetical protein n=1 Tax=Shewanella sp. AS16 TaxID=2907625 RepID=UPI001F43ABB0|nr:hypothetical protein [Shewanella sp. AS16]MCE9686040.1 hypothetical protein [Shewanella sp. AS16]